MSFLYYYLTCFSKIKQACELFFIDTVVWLFPVKICKAASVAEIMVVGGGPDTQHFRPSPKTL